MAVDPHSVRQPPDAIADQSSPAREASLVRGVDYYVEDGRWVFTAVYHRKRGYCCGSGCRHCPFTPATTVQDDP